MKMKFVIGLPLAVMLVLSGCGGSQQAGIARTIQFPSSQSDVIKAMSFNIRVDTFLDGFNGWSFRKQLVFDVLADHAPDVIGLQEVLDHQVGQIQQAFPQYTYYAAGRNDGKRKGESCVIFYRSDRFVPEDYGTFWFSDTPSEPGSKDWGNIWPRICSWIYLRQKATGAGFYVYNVHLDVFSQNSRRKSVELLAKRIAARKKNDPFIVTGDFNMGLDNPAMAYLQNVNSETSHPKMLSAWESLYPDRKGEGTRHSFRGGTSGPKIDHIPICAGASALFVEIDRRHADGRYPSDHFPVIAGIRLPGWSTRFDQVAAGIQSENELGP
jgi:endonuclease/exonuclease/phosphatase family metal-dependent hydrolase